MKIRNRVAELQNLSDEIPSIVTVRPLRKQIVLKETSLTPLSIINKKICF